MTTLIESTAPPPSAPPRRSKRLTLIALLAGLFGTAIAVFVITRGTTNRSQAVNLQRIAATQTACQRWLASGSSAVSSPPNAAWCSGMAAWMNTQMANGRMAAVWNNPQAMLGVCRHWTAAGTTGMTATTAPNAAGWCDQMVTWMTQQMGSWGTRQDWDSHMGGWGNGMMNR